VPLRFSARITPQPAARKADSSSDRKRDQAAKFNCEKSHSRITIKVDVAACLRAIAVIIYLLM
jgi:hypothetical protein